MKWQISSLLAMISFSCAYCCFRRLAELGITTVAQMALVGSLMAFGFVSMALFRKELLMVGMKSWPFIILAAVTCVLGNYWQTQALGKAQNPGYALAIVSCSVAVVYLLSIPLFGCAMDFTKLSGMLLCGLGVVLICL